MDHIEYLKNISSNFGIVLNILIKPSNKIRKKQPIRKVEKITKNSVDIYA